MTSIRGFPGRCGLSRGNWRAIVAAAFAILMSWGCDEENNDWNTYVLNAPPSQPELVYPEFGEAGVEWRPTFEWSESVDEDEDEIKYDVYLGSNPDNLVCIK